MKRYHLFLFILLCVAVLTGYSQDKKEKKAKEATITGEVTDVKCYLNGMASSSDDHTQCAIDCIKGGLPVGVVEDKTEKLYVLVPERGMKGANEELVKYASHKVKITGTFREKGGQKMFFYTKVEEAEKE